MYASGWDYDTNNEVEYWLFRSSNDGSSWEKCSDNFNFYINPNYTFSSYEPYKMWYIDENSDFWLGDVQNMTGTGISTVEMITNNNLSIYPNPFNPATTISFSIPTESKIELTVYNTKGQKVKTLINNKIEKGNHSTNWYGKDENNNSVSSGVYFYKLNVNNEPKAIKKSLLLK